MCIIINKMGPIPRLEDGVHLSNMCKESGSQSVFHKKCLSTCYSMYLSSVLGDGGTTENNIDRMSDFIELLSTCITYLRVGSAVETEKNGLRARL